MPIPANKEELIRAIENDSTKLLDAFRSIPLSDWGVATIEGNTKGTLISPSNLLAYQIGWGSLALSWYKMGVDNQEFAMPMEGYKWNELGKLADHFHQKYEGYSSSELLTMFINIVNEVLELVHYLSNSQLYTVGIYDWTGRYTLGRYIQLNTSSPYKNALIKLRKFSKNR